MIIVHLDIIKFLVVKIYSHNDAAIEELNQFNIQYCIDCLKKFFDFQCIPTDYRISRILHIIFHPAKFFLGKSDP
jgi:hypothetical protein